ncbi:MAG: cupin domain-containing protein [Chloroflexi bacterium]|nr:cupin domain-containing protein [Chloroflexota bacterium]
MEAGPGIHVASSSTDSWVPDPEVPGTEMHELVRQDGVWAGMTRMTAVAGPVEFTPEQRETICVLEGHARIEFAGGAVIEVGPGDIASLPPGVATTWHITVPYKEMWLFAPVET